MFLNVLDLNRISSKFLANDLFTVSIIFLNLLSISFTNNLPQNRLYENSNTLHYNSKFSKQNSEKKWELASIRLMYKSPAGVVTLSLSTARDSVIIDLSRNDELFGSGYFIKTFTDKDVPKISKPNAKFSSAQCHYHGKVRSEPDSLVSLNLCNGVSGAVLTKHVTLHIEPKDPSVNGRHYVHVTFASSNQTHSQQLCGFKTQPPNTNYESNTNHKLKKRSLPLPYDWSSKTRVVELYLVNDFTQFNNMGRSVDAVVRRTENIVNLVNSFYRQLNIYVSLIGIEVWNRADKITMSRNAETLMNNFLVYRRLHINPQHKNDNSQLITGVTFEDGVVGKALKTVICSHQYSGGVSMDHSVSVAPVATTVAHEIGHNFGMEHDTSVCLCPDRLCIMAAISSGVSPTKWSSCSKDHLVDSFHQGLDYCLHDLPSRIESGPVCGNGFTEPGEQCDCGLEKDCMSPCCNASTCLFTVNSTCASGACCDVATCQLKPAATVCREAANRECDLPEYCSGTDPSCPTDVFMENGLPCNNDELFCYNGSCNSLSSACRFLWGPTAHSAPEYYYAFYNKFGITQGSCGFDWTKMPRSEASTKCDPEYRFAFSAVCLTSMFTCLLFT